MDRVADFRQIISTYLNELAQIPFSPGVQLHHLAIEDEKRDQYVLFTLGQHRGERVYATDIHLAIEQDKVLLLESNVDWSVMEELEARGIPRAQMVDATNLEHLLSH